MIELDYATVRAELIKVGAASPNFVYGEERRHKYPDGSYAWVECYYVDDFFDEGGVWRGHQAGCIVGKVLNNLGVPLEDLYERNEDATSSLLWELGANGVIAIAESDVRDIDDLLSRAQLIQDDGKTWGDAVCAAITYVEISSDGE